MGLAEETDASITSPPAPPNGFSVPPPAPDVAYIQAASPADPSRPPQAVPLSRTDSDISVIAVNGEDGNQRKRMIEICPKPERSDLEIVRRM
jgi:hypothetical protein